MEELTVPFDKFINFLAVDYLSLLKQNTCNPFFQHSQNKKLSNQKIDIESSKCMGTFERCYIIQNLGEVLTAADFIWGKLVYFINLLDMIWY